MASSSNPGNSDMEETLRRLTEMGKIKMENEVFRKIVHYWEKLQRLQLLYETGEATASRLVVKMEKYRERLNVSEEVNIFEGDYIYQLMLHKEMKILSGLTKTENFLKSSTRELRKWKTMWVLSVEEEYSNVINRTANK